MPSHHIPWTADNTINNQYVSIALCLYKTKNSLSWMRPFYSVFSWIVVAKKPIPFPFFVSFFFFVLSKNISIINKWIGSYHVFASVIEINRTFSFQLTNVLYFLLLLSLRVVCRSSCLAYVHVAHFCWRILWSFRLCLTLCHTHTHSPDIFHRSHTSIFTIAASLVQWNKNTHTHTLARTHNARSNNRNQIESGSSSSSSTKNTCEEAQMA